MKERIAIIDGIRTPFCKAGGVLKETSSDDLGAYVVKELMIRTAFPKEKIDELIFGCVGQPVDATNVARVLALKAGLPISLPACTVQRNCASGMEALTSAANQILAGQAEVILAGATEAMSQIPLLYNKKMTAMFTRLAKAKTVGEKLSALASFRPSFLKPIIGLEAGLTDPICGMIMGLTAEILSREFKIGRDEQDEFALNSHKKAANAMKKGYLAEEIIPIPVAPRFSQLQTEDDGPRKDQTLEALGKLKPYFDRVAGSVTVGNSCQITDGACATLLMTESKAKEMGYTPIGYLREYAYAALEPDRMGLGPVYATAKLFERTGLSVSDFDLFEMNEAFAVQVIANQRAFASDEFSKKYLGREKALGKIDPEKLNVNGGAIALGHPVGATGTRLVITLLKELKRRKKNLGLASLCVGGGQGAALALEVE
ncbi:MAG: acetyl-CoA acetyltransferase family protein [Chlamydiales bacterium]|jgi:acetyl-CoA acetyltransferase family protein